MHFSGRTFVTSTAPDDSDDGGSMAVLLFPLLPKLTTPHIRALSNMSVRMCNNASWASCAVVVKYGLS